ncbi:MAG: DNA glycosylase [Acutalibacteraceae bacterium]|nr:DNA glycosylase [Acutalibacteraceae bacterium]
MKIKYSDNNVILEDITSFNIEQTLDCGQCFRWEMIEPNKYHGVAYGKPLTISQQENSIILHSCTKTDFENIWFNYFDLGTNYDEIKKELAQLHPVLKDAQQYAPGIRILRQEPWEALCSFIISQNNNIPRIKGIIKKLCENFGNKLSNGDYTFPTAEALSNYTVDDLAILKSGFRAKYIVDASQKVASKEVDLEYIINLPTAQARDELIKIKGVGPKVADCTMLYGMGKTDCFPLDVWMKRAMQILFPKLTPQSFGKNAGVAQQYIFHYSRMNPQLFEENNKEQNK